MLYNKKRVRFHRRGIGSILVVIVLILLLRETGYFESDSLPQTAPVADMFDLLHTALYPLGNTMYVWGGGWGEPETGLNSDAVKIGIQPGWKAFASLQDENYDFELTRFQVHDGLDCSGYVGWVIYNTLETESGRDSYVVSSTKMARYYSELGFGNYRSAEKGADDTPGNIMSMEGHVWICLGSCPDGSVVLIHSSPPGVSICGTLLPDGGKSEAVRLAEYYMKTYFPDWYSKYPNCAKPDSYLKNSASMRWGENILTDVYGIRKMMASEVLQLLFCGEKYRKEP